MPSVLFELTLDDQTAVWLKQFYQSGRSVVLEYGTGGSTVLALESHPETVVYACETDSAWLSRLMLHLAEKKISDRVYPVHLDIGSTGAWGVPVFDGELPMTSSRMQKFLQAPLTPWKLIQKHEQYPDLVVIDGRWRNACFLATLLFARKKTLVLWDDYLDRSQYHLFETLIGPAHFVGRSAIYEVAPSQYDAAEVIAKYLSVFADWG